VDNSTGNFKLNSFWFADNLLYCVVISIGIRCFYLGFASASSCGSGFDLWYLYPEKEKLGMGGCWAFYRMCTRDLLIGINMVSKLDYGLRNIPRKPIQTEVCSYDVETLLRA
jgi:hypothetical protein